VLKTFCSGEVEETADGLLTFELVVNQFPAVDLSVIQEK